MNKNWCYFTSTELTNSGIMPTNVSDFLSNQPAPGTMKPKAFSLSLCEQVRDDRAF